MSGKEMGCCRKAGLIGLRTHEAGNSADDRQRYRGARPGPSRSAPASFMLCCTVYDTMRADDVVFERYITTK